MSVFMNSLLGVLGCLSAVFQPRRTLLQAVASVFAVLGVTGSANANACFEYDLNTFSLPAPYSSPASCTSEIWFDNNPVYKVDSPNSACFQASAASGTITDHTTGSTTQGTILGIQAGPGSDFLPAIQFTTSVTQNTDYELNFAHMIWARSDFSTSDFRGALRVYVNGALVDTLQGGAGKPFGEWEEYTSAAINSGFDTSLDIRIDIRRGANNFGNDYLFDSINVREVGNAFCGVDTDYGDAPISYGEAGHTIVSGVSLGAGDPDIDTVNQPDANALGDDNDGTDDENGITIPPLAQGQSATITASVSGAGGYLQGWIDWNGNGMFEAGEQVATNLQDGNSDGLIDVSVTPPATASTTQTFARFRWSMTQNLDSMAAASDGEVEDYAVTVLVASDISGTVFNDANRNGTLDGGEAGLASGINVLLWDDANGNFRIDPAETTMSATTDALGKYGFSGLTNSPNYRVVVLTTDPDIPTEYHLYGTYRTNFIKDTPYSGAEVNNIDFAFVAPQDVLATNSCVASGGSRLGANLLTNGDFGTLTGSPAPGTNSGSGMAEVTGLDYVTMNGGVFTPNDAFATGGQGQYSIINKAVPEYGYDSGWDQAPIWHGLSGRGGGTTNLMGLFNLSTAGEIFYEKTLNVAPGTLYELSGWFSNLSSLAYEQGAGGTYANPNLEFAIDRVGVDDDNDGSIDEVGEAVTIATSGELLPTNHAVWREAAGLFNTGAATSVRVILKNFATGRNGNDLAVDDIALHECSVLKIVDRSDAPISGASPDNGSTNSYGEASHDIVTGYRLGANIDSDNASIASAAADGDGTDDDGIAFPVLTQGEAATITASVSGAGGYLQGWIDWNGDGSFGAGEQVAMNLQDGAGLDTNAAAGTIAFSVTPPATAITTQTFARFRWSATQNLDSTTAASDGEVEDYVVTVAPGGPFAVIPLLTCTSDGSIFSTGYDGSGGRLVSGDRDISWEVGLGDITGPASVGSYSVAHVGNQIPAAWAASPFSNAEWVSHSTDARHPGDQDYYYRYRFDLDAAVDLASFQINLDFFADNTVHEIYVNGVAQSAGITGVPQNTSDPYQFNGYRSANRAQTSLSSDFVTGRNELIVQLKSGTPRAGFLAQSTSPGLCNRDYSDAPSGYPTTSHEIVDGLYLGTTPPDADTGTLQSANADGDDNSFSNDEDGVTIPALAQYDIVQIDVRVNQNAANEGYLQGWIDWNGNNSFDTGEQIAGDRRLGSTSGIISIPVSVPANAAVGTTFARFRWSTTRGLDASTDATDGEVEDYPVTISGGSAGVVTLGSCSSGDAPWTVEWVDNSAENYAPSPPGTGVQTAAATPKLAGVWVDSPAGSEWITYVFPGAQNGLGLHRDADLDGNPSELVSNTVSGTADHVLLRYRLNVSLSDPSGVVLEGLGAVDNTVRSITVNGTTVSAGFTGLTSLRSVSIETGWVAGINEVVFDVTSGPHLVGLAVGDCIITRRDYSDAVADGGTAPDGSTANYGVARHEVVSGFRLGSTNTAEISAVENADNAADDGIAAASLSSLIPGQSSTIPVTVQGAGGFLQAWIDWNGDGAFDDSSERIATDLQDNDGDGTIFLPVNVPSFATTAQTFARFRWSTDFRIGSDGLAPDGEVEDYAVTLGITGPVLSGNLFIDNGTGGGTAHDGIIGGTEFSAAVGTLVLVDGGGAEIATPTVNADGTWQAQLPAGFSGAVQLIATALPGYRLISEDRSAVPGASSVSETDGTYSFNAATGVSYAGLNIGLIAEPTLTQNQNASVSPGQIIDLSHRYEATTTGTVSFALVDQLANPDQGFAVTLFEDTNCDGAPDQVLSASVPVTAGQFICLVARTQASSGVGPGASITYGLTASTVYTDTTASGVIRNDDEITTGGDGDELVLRKFVSNQTKLGVEGTSNTGDIGDVLRYRILMSNPGPGSANDVTVSDTTPAYTTLEGALAPAVTVAAGVTCDLIEPAAGANATGYSGPLKWNCPGAFPPGLEGSLSFDVRISE